MRVTVHGRFEKLNAREMDRGDFPTFTLLLDFEVGREPLTKKDGTKCIMLGHQSALIYRGNVKNCYPVQWDVFLEEWIAKNLGSIVSKKAPWPDGGESDNRVWIVECDEHSLLTHEDKMVRYGAKSQIEHQRPKG
jgi:hypothetical protein